MFCYLKSKTLLKKKRLLQHHFFVSSCSRLFSKVHFCFSKKTDYLCSVWLFIQSLFGDQKTVLSKKLLYSIEVINFLKSNVKRYFTSNYFFRSSGGLKTAKRSMFWNKLCALWRAFSYCWESNAKYLCVAKCPAQQNRSKWNWG